MPTDQLQRDEHHDGDRILPRATLADRVADALMADIYERSLRPGAILPSEADMAKTFGVSRLVVREAVRTLVAREVLDSGQGRPARVREPSSHILTQLFEYHLRQRSLDVAQIVGTRGLLEGQIAYDAAIAVRDQGRDPASLFAALERMRNEATGTRTFLAADDVFHSALAELADNPVISLIMQGLHGLMNEARELSHAGNLATHGSQELALEEHQAVAEAVRAGEADAARVAMQVLVQRTLENVRAAQVT